jgi:hypothetical protein
MVASPEGPSRQNGPAIVATESRLLESGSLLQPKALRLNTS